MLNAIPEGFIDGARNVRPESNFVIMSRKNAAWFHFVAPCRDVGKDSRIAVIGVYENEAKRAVWK